MSLVNDHVRRQLAEINQLLNERDLVQQGPVLNVRLQISPNLRRILIEHNSYTDENLI